MKDCRNDFASFDGKIWLNAASEGPLPLAARRALEEAVEWKSKPYELTLSRFASVPRELRTSLGRLLGVAGEEVILGNSASYGLHILANGLSWKKGDEIILMQNDFPTNILPWLALEMKGVNIRQVVANDKVLEPEELLANITDKTRLVCLSHVHTFSGYVLDIKRMGEICCDKKITFVVNLSQSAGTMAIDLSQWAVDAVVCAGYKWLCGPYGAGFFWMTKALRESLDYNQAYWTVFCSTEDMENEEALKLASINTARKYDVFGTANFFNFSPFVAAVNYWLSLGLDHVRSYHDQLLDKIVAELPAEFYLISPQEGPRRSSLLVFSHKQKSKNKTIYRSLQDRGIYTALWKNHLRVSAHVYNTVEEIDKFMRVLREIKF